MSKRDIIGGLRLLAIGVGVIVGGLMVIHAFGTADSSRFVIGGVGAAMLTAGVVFSGLADSAEDRADPDHWWNRYLR